MVTCLEDRKERQARKQRRSWQINKGRQEKEIEIKCNTKDPKSTILNALRM